MRNFLVFLAAFFVVVLGFFFLDSKTALIFRENAVAPLRIEGKGMEANAKGVQELAQGHNEIAIASLRTADRLQPGNSVIRRNLSIALARAAMEKERGEKEAMELLYESLDLWPRNPEGLDGMSTVHFRNARYEEALPYAIKLRGVLPDRPELDAFIAYLEEKAELVEGMTAEKGDRFRLLYSGERKLEFEGEIIAVLQTEMDALTASLGVFPEDPVDVLILTEDLGERSEAFLPFVEGLYDGQIRLFVGDGIRDRERFIRTVRHEMVHALLHHVSGNIPAWVHEGLAQKVGEEPSEERIRKVREYIRASISRGYGVDLESLGPSFIEFEEGERSRAYAVSLLFMDWVEKKYGQGVIPRFVSEISTGTSATAAMVKVTGAPFEKMERSFHEYLTQGS